MPIDLSHHFPLLRGRTHEVCGAGAVGFAMSLAGQLDGPVFWIGPGWQAARINPAGFGAFVDPHRLLFARCRDQSDILASAEEALRSGAVTLVIVELDKPIGLTAGRRLQLAAEAGKTTGLCLVPEGMGSNAAQTRWRCNPVFDPADSTLQQWELIKNKSGTLTMWDVRWDAETRRVIMVSETGQRPVS